MRKFFLAAMLLAVATVPALSQQEQQSKEQVWVVQIKGISG